MGEWDEGGNQENGECNGTFRIENDKDSKPWTTFTSIGDIQKQSKNWTLAGDAALLEFLQGFSHQLISRTHEIEKHVDQLIHETKVTSSRVNNIINDFLMLSNTQFIENRVYDDDIQAETPAQPNKQEEQKTKEQREAELIPQISTALALGLEVIDKAFDQVEIQGDSDSEDEEGKTVHGESLLEPKDPYLHRPLPHVIGSASFYNDDTVGLFDLISNDVESESDQKEYDSGGESSDESFEEPIALEKENAPIQNEILRDGMLNFAASSDSESSDIFGDEAEKISGSADSDEFMKPEKPNNVDTSPAKDKGPKPEEDESEDLFSDVFVSNRNDEKPSFLQSSSSKNSLFDDDEDDSFEETTSKTKERTNTEQSAETVEETAPQKKVNDLKGKQVMIAKGLDALFQTSDDDLFTPKNVLEKAKSKESAPQKMVNDLKGKQVMIAKDLDALFQTSDDDLFTPKNVLEKAKSKERTSSIASDVKVERTTSVTTEVKVEKTKGTPTDVKPERTKSFSLFDDDDDDDDEDTLFANKTTKSSTKSESSSNILMEEDEFEDSPVTKPVIPSSDIKSPLGLKSTAKEVGSLFTDDTEDDLFDILEETKKPIPQPHTETTSEHSIASTSPQQPLTESPIKLPEDKSFEKKIVEEKTTMKSQPDMFSLLDDDDDDDLFSLPKKDSRTKDALGSSENKVRRGSSLFEDDDLFKKDSADSPDVDLFATKPIKETSMKPKKEMSAKVQDVDLFKKDVYADSPGVDLFSTKPQAETTAKTEVPTIQDKLSDMLSDSSKSQRKPPVGGVPLFGSADIFGKSKISPEKPDILEGVSEPVPVPKVEETKSVKSTDQISVSFDDPVDTSNTLSCAAKGRAKIQTRRRPPSRKGRQSIAATPEAMSEKPETVDNVDSTFDDSKKAEPVSMPTQNKEMNIDILTSPSTEEDDIFPLADPASRDIFSSIEPRKDVSFTDSLFSNTDDKKSSKIMDDIFGDDIFSVPVGNSTKPILSTSPDDIFAEAAVAKESSLFSSSSSRQHQSKISDIFSEPEEDIFSSLPPVKPAPTVTKKQPSIKQVKRESDIFDDPLLGFSNADND